MVANRYALLIGVPDYEDPAFNQPQLQDAVTADISAMRAALSQSDYEITECGTPGSGGEATPTRIRRAIKTACSNVPPGGTLLIYYSGHGLMIDGKDYLVPTDAYRADARSDLGSLVRIMPADALSGCQARLVVFFADACRTDPAEEETAGNGSGEPGGEMPFPAGGGHFVQVMGCGAGQVCHYDESGSTFTGSLAKVLDARNPARTLKEVIDEVSRDMARRSRQSHGEPQEPVIRYSRVLDLAGGIDLCDGDERAAAWRKAVEASSLLKGDSLRDRVQDIVAECAKLCGNAEETLRKKTGLTDPWTDQDYPVRVLRQCESLVPADVLLPNENALLIAAPFLREAVLAVGTLDAAGIAPASLDRTYTPGLRGDLELTHEMHQHLVRRASGLREQARNAPGDAIDPQAPQAKAADHLALWLVHRWLSGRVQLWDTPEVKKVCKLGRSLLPGYRPGFNDTEERRCVETLLLAVGAEPDDERLLGQLGAPYMDSHLRLVAAVLWLVSTTAADLRRLPPVVADLLGTGMELSFSDLQDAAARRAAWRVKDSDMDLDLVCEHPAMHETFAGIVERAAAVREAIRSRQFLSDGLDGKLPRTFTANGLRAAIRQDDEPAYAVPLSRFQIAEEKVRELLMGKQIYGDQSLAIRELYQNALDACRWRQTRQDYQLRKNGVSAHWSGLIRFRQDTDGAGRPFIECEDNGVGMDMGTLKHVFANAGERFVYGQEFRAEQAAWAELNPPLSLISNSQFGVGVFSYFMLADEITVTTRPQHRNGGVDHQAYEVRIASSGSLVQIRRVADELPEGGTTVRLYLGGDVKGVSVLRTLRDLLWVAEHRVEVNGPDGTETWKPGELRRPNDSVAPLQYGEDLWWVAGEGGIAADGIKTSEERYGLVVNLRGERRPKFTVDRNNLQEWDKESVTAEIEQSIPGLVDWPGFTLYWLWQVALRKPEIGQQIYEYVTQVGSQVRIGEAWSGSAEVQVSAVGCLADDYRLFIQDGDQYAQWFAAWRVGVWQDLAPVPTSQSVKAIARRSTGFPIPDPIDSSLFHSLNSFQMNSRPSAARILRAFADSDVSMIAQLRRLRRYAITGLDVSRTRHIPPIPHVTKDDDDGSLLPAFAAWTNENGQWKLTSAGPLLWASFHLDQSIGEVYRRIQKMLPDSQFLPMPELGDLSTHTCSKDDVRLLSRNNSLNMQEWVRSPLSPAHLIRVSDDTRSSLTSIIAKCEKFSPLGTVIAMRDAYPEDLNLIETLALRYTHVAGEKLNPIHLALIAGQAGTSIDSTHAELARLENCGLISRPSISGSPDFIPGSEEIEYIRESLLRPSWEEEPGRCIDKPWRVVVRTLIEEEALGRTNRRRTMEHISPFAAPTSPVEWSDLIGMAFGYGNEKKIGQVTENIQRLYPEAILPAISDERGELKGTYAAFWVLGNWGPYEAATHGPMWMGSMLKDSGQLLGNFLSQLEPFRIPGDWLSSCDDLTLDELNEISFDDYDVNLLTTYSKIGQVKPLKVIDALRYVQIAGRFGWTLAEAQARLTKLAVIGVTLDYPQVDLPEEIVYWYDLQALTTYFDGQEPVISGTINQAYLERAAEEIFDVGPGEVPEKAALLRERLQIYQPLFGYVLDAEPVTGTSRPG